MAVDTPFGRRARHLIAIAVLGLIGLTASGQELAGQQQAGQADPAEQTATYFYELDADGNPEFTQVLSWEAVAHVRRYRLEVEDAAGQLIHEQTSVEPQQEVQLPPGEYRYRIVLYNLLDQPELATGWYPILIRQALQPEIAGLEPGVVYLEDERFELLVTGQDLEPDAEFILLDYETGQQRYQLSLQQLQEDGVELRLPARIDAGEFLLQITNPGGLYERYPEPLRVRYQKPIDLAVLAGWSPVFPLMDDWVTRIWPETVYPVGADLQLDVIFLKRWFGYLGIGVNLTAAGFTGGEADARVVTTLGRLDLQLVYSYYFSPRWLATLRLGGGVTYTDLQMEYTGGVTGEPFATTDPGYSLGLALGYEPVGWLRLGPAARLHLIPYRDNTALFFTPGLYAGWVY
ncbi:hypothetical protein [Spirochaeta africana]|uniref:Uncharacterized protein n=1 Tax=Spirochaeta africana (strain ATCC 700263 / DSM 8902 / Z-7692) TaxID=889378 RepID=H9UGD3_SPIAZ|nr:hypothetical protein [Spirochaeta africana]AFG36576.1 hypothetical protein Spiaf_0473 [Spirochaeta africana DSM 8902]